VRVAEASGAGGGRDDGRKRGHAQHRQRRDRCRRGGRPCARAAFRRRCYSNLYLILAGSHWHGGRKARALAWGLQAVITFPPSLRRLLLKSVQALGK
jgi:hypothetical protein